MNFNPRSREGSDGRSWKRLLPIWTFQSTLPRRERRCICQSGNFISFISIHAPAKGATRSTQGWQEHARRISIHAPAKGATTFFTPKHCIYTNFNPRSREGSDTRRSLLSNLGGQFQSTLPRRERLVSLVHCHGIRAISIHAPAKGATLPAMPVRASFRISIHAPAKGATGARKTDKSTQGEFQSTLPRRERRRNTISSVGTLNFNPRSREGSDFLFLRHFRTSKAFQSTLPRRERPPRAAAAQSLAAFQSTLPRRERLVVVLAGGLLVYISIHAPAKGATIAHGYKKGMAVQFQSTLPRRERRILRRLIRNVVEISIHAPAKGATLSLSIISSGSRSFQSTLPRRERRN